MKTQITYEDWKERFETKLHPEFEIEEPDSCVFYSDGTLSEPTGDFIWENGQLIPIH